MRSRVRRFAHCLLWAVVLISSATVPAFSQDVPVDAQLTGRLATVEPSRARVTLIPDGEDELVEFFAAEDCEVRQDERKLSLAELVIQVGRRVTVRYHVDTGRRVARAIIVDPES